MAFMEHICKNCSEIAFTSSVNPPNNCLRCLYDKFSSTCADSDEELEVEKGEQHDNESMYIL